MRSRKVLKFLHRSQAERGLLIKSMLLLLVAKLGLAILPFAVLRRICLRIGQPRLRSRHLEGASLATIAWAVATAGRNIPNATCLPLAIVVEMLLRRRGYPACLQIGVTKDETGSLEAHAWVECDGEVVIGGPVPDGYVTLPGLNAISL